MASNEHTPQIWEIAGTWMSLQRLWEKVVGSEKVTQARSGGWRVRKEEDGQTLVPGELEPDEVVVYIEKKRHLLYELGRWPLAEVVDYDTEEVDHRHD